MSRPSIRRTPMLEALETRQVLSTVVGPTPDQQYALQLINLVRTDPSEAATMITSNLSPTVEATLNQYGLTVAGLTSELDAATPQPPLAWSDALGATAQAQSQYEADNAVQTHQGPGQADLTDRINSAGYTNAVSYGENTYAYAESTEEAMQAFLFDWGVSDHGHYNNLLQPGVSADDSYRDVGIGLVNTSNSSVGPLVLTQDFGSQNNEAPQILGVVYDDPNHTGFYAPGEGQAGVTINAVNLTTGQDYQTQSFGSGGYQVPVAPNAEYQVTATENGQVISSQQVDISDVNAEADFINNPATNQPAPAPVTPTPAVPPAPSVPSVTTTQASVAPQTTPAPQTLVPNPPQQDQSTTINQQPPASSTTTETAPPWLSGWSRWTAATINF